MTGVFRVVADEILLCLNDKTVGKRTVVFDWGGCSTGGPTAGHTTLAGVTLPLVCHLRLD